MNIGMLIEEELAKETPIKGTNTWKGNNQNRDKKDKGCTCMGVHALDCYTEYPLVKPPMLKYPLRAMTCLGYIIVF